MHIFPCPDVDREPGADIASEAEASPGIDASREADTSRDADAFRGSFGAVTACLAHVETVIGRWPVDATVRLVLAAAPATSPVVHLAAFHLDGDGVTVASASWVVDLGPVVDVTFWARFEWWSSEVVRPWLAAHGVPGHPDDVDPDGWSLRFARRVWQR